MEYLYMCMLPNHENVENYIRQKVFMCSEICQQSKKLLYVFFSCVKLSGGKDINSKKLNDTHLEEGKEDRGDKKKMGRERRNNRGNRI